MITVNINTEEFVPQSKTYEGSFGRSPRLAQIVGFIPHVSRSDQAGAREGNLSLRTDQADYKITAALGDPEHEVRLGQNRDRLTTRALVWSAVEAKQSAEFADALGYFPFVFTKPKAALEA